MKLLVSALTAFTLACASAPPEAPAPTPVATVQTENAAVGLMQYQGTYALQAPSTIIELRVWIDADGALNGELVGRGQQTVFRSTDTPHKFLHATSDEVSFEFTVVNGKAISATMRQRGREISGPRKD